MNLLWLMLIFAVAAVALELKVRRALRTAKPSQPYIPHVAPPDQNAPKDEAWEAQMQAFRQYLQDKAAAKTAWHNALTPEQAQDEARWARALSDALSIQRSFKARLDQGKCSADAYAALIATIAERKDAHCDSFVAQLRIDLLPPELRGEAWLTEARSGCSISTRYGSYRRATQQIGFNEAQCYQIAQEFYDAAIQEPESSFRVPHRLEDGQDIELERIALWVIELALKAGRLTEARQLFARHTPSASAEFAERRSDLLAKLEALENRSS